MDCDLLLFQFPNFGQPVYFVGIAAIKSYLDARDLVVNVEEPISKYFEKLSDQERAEFSRLNLDHEIYTKKDLTYVKKVEKLYAEEIKKHRPKIVGFSTIHGNIHISLEMIERLKRKFPKTYFAVGGIGMRINSLRCAPDVILWDRWKYQEVDFLVKGEAELSLEEIFLHLEDQDFSKIPNLTYKKEKRYFQNSPQPANLNIESIPFPNFYPFMEVDFYKKETEEAYPVTFSRGCPYSCSFCSVPEYSMKYRYYSVAKSLKEIERLYQDHKIDNFSCMDSICNGNNKWLKKFCLGIYLSRLPISWGGSFRLQKQMRKKRYFDVLGLGRCNTMIFGLESGSPTVLKHMKKFHNREIIDQIFEVIREVKKERNLEIHLQIIVGYPTETDEDFDQTIELIDKFSDVITSINSMGAFLLGETQHLVDEMKRDYNLEMVDSSNWSTSVCTPEDRLRRFQKLEDLLIKKGIPYRPFYKSRLETLLEQGRAVV